MSRVENSSKVTCNHCGTEISSKVERIKAHLAKCIPLQHVHGDDDDGVGQSEPQPSCSSESHNADEVEKKPLTKKRKLQKSMNMYSVKTSSSEKEILDMKMASFFYANNIPFNAANSEQYQQIIIALRPGYTGPSCDQIGGKPLDNISDVIDKEVEEHITDNCVITLIMDVWSSIRNDPINDIYQHTCTYRIQLELLPPANH